MGSMVHVHCDGCALDRGILFLGAGMAGNSQTLCRCEHCRRVVVKRQQWDDPPAPLRCPYCRRSVVEIDERSGSTSCPTCGGVLLLDWVGVWD